MNKRTEMISQKNNTRRRCRRYGRRRAGASAVEFAMVAPTFLFVCAVCGEFARMSIMRNLAQNACYEAARYAMTEGASIDDGIERANEILSRLGRVEATVTVNGNDGTDTQNQIEFDTPMVTVRIEIPLKDNTLIFPESMFGENRITAQMSVRTERYRGFFDSQIATN